MLDRYVPLFVPDVVPWTLANTDEVDIAAQAMGAAIRHKIAAEIRAGLSHRSAIVAARALKAVETPLAPPLPAATAARKAVPLLDRAFLSVL